MRLVPCLLVLPLVGCSEVLFDEGYLDDLRRARFESDLLQVEGVLRLPETHAVEDVDLVLSLSPRCRARLEADPFGFDLSLQQPCTYRTADLAVFDLTARIDGEAAVLEGLAVQRVEHVGTAVDYPARPTFEGPVWQADYTVSGALERQADPGGGLHWDGVVVLTYPEVPEGPWEVLRDGRKLVARNGRRELRWR